MLGPKNWQAELLTAASKIRVTVQRFKLCLAFYLFDKTRISSATLVYQTHPTE